MASGSTPARAESEDTVLVNISLQEESNCQRRIHQTLSLQQKMPVRKRASSRYSMGKIWKAGPCRDWRKPVESGGWRSGGGRLGLLGGDYQRAVQNFILRFDVKFDPRGNSGILFHTDSKAVFRNAPEIQFAADDSPEVSKDKLRGQYLTQKG